VRLCTGGAGKSSAGKEASQARAKKEAAAEAAASRKSVVGGRGLFALQLVDPRVGEVGDLGQDQEVVAAEAGSGLPLVAVLVEAGKGGVVPHTGLCVVLPDGGLDRADSDFNGFLLVCHCEISFFGLERFRSLGIGGNGKSQGRGSARPRP